MKAVVRKDFDRIYKSYCWNAHFDAVTVVAWNVVNAETGEVIERAVANRGANNRAGYMRFARKKNAAAWAAGFNGEPRPADSELASEWDDGAYSRRLIERKRA